MDMENFGDFQESDNTKNTTKPEGKTFGHAANFRQALSLSQSQSFQVERYKRELDKIEYSHVTEKNLDELKEACISLIRQKMTMTNVNLYYLQKLTHNGILP